MHCLVKATTSAAPNNAGKTVSHSASTPSSALHTAGVTAGTTFVVLALLFCARTVVIRSRQPEIKYKRVGQQEHEFPEDRDNPFEYFNTPVSEEDGKLGETEDEAGIEMEPLPPPRTGDLSDDDDL